MNLIDICIITMLASIIMRIKAKVEIYKDISDLGYKFNHKKIEKLTEEEIQDIDIVIDVIGDYYIYIPVYNLFKDAIRENNYYQNKEAKIEKLKKCGILREMTNEEKEEYSKNKTGYDAIKMEKIKKIKMEQACQVKLQNESTIWFNLKTDTNTSDFNDIIEIIEVEGIKENISLEDLKKLVYCSLILTGDNLINTLKKESKDLDSQINNPQNQDIIINNEIEIPFDIPENKPKTKVRKK